ncbi:hypothetical protein [Actinomadura sp. HBU206391]|uniref:hypothetical protein n=1 Tax=Actinomadura sp. HBU206391 TaxID=2731692 RepID=UPI00164F9BE3|nr:hypothetical protein [Actinomadura sp. HBU206391]MBC6460928.1 hypothetical protein [Actinomadura sp. HBU206391]
MDKGRGRVHRLLAGVLCAGMLAALTACGGGGEGGGKTTIRFAWWGNDDRAKITNEAVALFMRKNPDIKVETTTAIYDSYF